MAASGEAPTTAVADRPTEDAGPPAPAPRPGDEERSRVPRGRFLAVYGLLALVLAAAAVGLVFLVAEPGKSEPPPFSAWEPSASDTLARAQEIADHVAPAYRLPSGSQLVGVQAAPPRVQDVPLGAIAVRSQDEPIEILPVEGAVSYILCGFGEECSIPEGEPSAERLLLLRREALELALYTFRYVDDVDHVVAFLPPPPGEQAAFALLLRRDDLAAELDRPLRATLPAEPPPLPGEIGPLEAATIERLTGTSLHRFAFQQLQDGTAVLLLDEPSLPEPEAGGAQDEDPEGGSGQ